MDQDFYDPDPDGRGAARRHRRSHDLETGGGVGRMGAGHDEPTDEPKKAKKKMPLWQELPLLLIVGFCVAVLVRTFLVQAFFIPSGSMENTLLVGDRVLVNKVVYDVRKPERGEVIVFRGTDDWAPEARPVVANSFMAKVGRTVADLVGMGQPGEKDFIKRVMGLPGDQIACCEAGGRVTVNGYPLDEPYVTDNSPLDVPPSPRSCSSRRFGPVTVPPGQMFVMGDHRAVSQDSRCEGPVPFDNVIGRAFVVVWPNDRWAGLSLPSTFEKVPKPVAAGSDLGNVPSQPRSPAVPAVVVGLPILAALAVPARSRRTRRTRRRTLPP